MCFLLSSIFDIQGIYGLFSNIYNNIDLILKKEINTCTLGAAADVLWPK